jgi:amino acid permease
MQNRKSRRTTTTTAAVSSSSSLLIPSTSISLRRNSKKTINNDKYSQRRKISKRFIPWLLFILLTITVALMVYASHGLFLIHVIDPIT